MLTAEATKAPIPNQSKKKVGVKISAITKNTPKISQTTNGSTTTTPFKV